MLCPQCKKEIEKIEGVYCPYCGFNLSQQLINSYNVYNTKQQSIDNQPISIENKKVSLFSHFPNQTHNNISNLQPKTVYVKKQNGCFGWLCKIIGFIIIGFFVLFFLSMSLTEDKSDTNVSSPATTTSIQETIDDDGIHKILIEGKYYSLKYGQIGKYGKPVKLNDSTYIHYTIPPGKYDVYSIGPVGTFYIESNKIFLDEYGRADNKTINEYNFTYANQKKSFSISSEEHILLSINTQLIIVPTD